MAIESRVVTATEQQQQRTPQDSETARESAMQGQPLEQQGVRARKPARVRALQKREWTVLRQQQQRLKKLQRMAPRMATIFRA